jgi:hypothetical protein
MSACGRIEGHPEPTRRSTQRLLFHAGHCANLLSTGQPIASGATMSELQHDAESPTENAASKADAHDLADARRVAKSNASAGGRDLRDAETYRALHEKEKP